MTTQLPYVGRTSRGTRVFGAISDAGRFAEEKFEAGWLELAVTRDGEPVAGIGRCAETGNRTWWCVEEDAT